MSKKKLNIVCICATIVIVVGTYSSPYIGARIAVARLENAMTNGKWSSEGTAKRENSTQGVLVAHFDLVRDVALLAYLERSQNSKNVSLTTDMIGWKQRLSLIDELKNIHLPRSVVTTLVTVSYLSATSALEARIPFPGNDMAEEYFQGYLAEVLRRTDGIHDSVESLVLKVARETAEKYRTLLKPVGK